MASCKLCHQDRDLRRSHIIPEYLYSEFYNEKGHMAAIHGRQGRGWRALQSGLKERLFCEECEQTFNERWEKTFRAEWVVTCPLPDPWNVSGIHWVTVTYEPFKLFHLSVLFRASVSSLPTFGDVRLGPHEEAIRQMLVNNDVGEPWDYPVFGFAVVDPKKNNALVRLITRPVRFRFDGHICYGVVYGYAQWWVLVSSHRSKQFEQIALQPNGRMPFHAVPWNEIPIIQATAQALRNNES